MRAGAAPYNPEVTSTFLRRCTRWLIALLVFGTLQPVFAAAWAREAGTSVEVCTSQGMRRVLVRDALPDAVDSADAADPTAPADGASALHADHCPLCRVLGEALPDLARADLAFAPPRVAPLPCAEAPPAPGTAQRLTRATPSRAPPAA